MEPIRNPNQNYSPSPGELCSHETVENAVRRVIHVSAGLGRLSFIKSLPASQYRAAARNDKNSALDC